MCCTSCGAAPENPQPRYVLVGFAEDDGSRQYDDHSLTGVSHLKSLCIRCGWEHWWDACSDAEPQVRHVGKLPLRPPLRAPQPDLPGLPGLSAYVPPGRR
jgi:hypothetical protein